ncbi:MAG: SGNH/GDSL hydrolase family protein [Chitinophagaceae bacterium]
MLTVYDKKTKNILPLGNSITNGTSIYNSYRRSLWQLLHNGNYNFDFIGSWDKHHMGGAVPDADFDMDHDGHSGWKAHDILQPPGWDSIRGNIDNWLEKYKPDIVLMELGTNEVFQCTPIASAMKDFSVIIDKLRRKNPSVKILLAKIPPLGAQWASKKLCGNDTSYEQSVQLFNEAIVQFAHAKTKKKSPIIIVDQFTGVNPSADMYDDIHPNTTGEIKMAERWFETMKPFLKRLKRNN